LRGRKPEAIQNLILYFYIKLAMPKKQALHLYLEGLGFRSIGRILGVSNVSVLNWIRDFGEEVKELHVQSQEIEVVEVDEMRTYTCQKKLLLDLDCR
jgi:uncharacterized protein YjcR